MSTWPHEGDSNGIWENWTDVGVTLGVSKRGERSWPTL